MSEHTPQHTTRPDLSARTRPAPTDPDRPRGRRPAGPDHRVAHRPHGRRRRPHPRRPTDLPARRLQPPGRDGHRLHRRPRPHHRLQRTAAPPRLVHRRDQTRLRTNPTTPTCTTTGTPTTATCRRSVPGSVTTSPSRRCLWATSRPAARHHRRPAWSSPASPSTPATRPTGTPGMPADRLQPPAASRRLPRPHRGGTCRTIATPEDFSPLATAAANVGLEYLQHIVAATADGDMFVYDVTYRRGTPRPRPRHRRQQWTVAHRPENRAGTASGPTRTRVG
jgi:hypothetical protein